MELPNYVDGPFFQCQFCGVTDTAIQKLKRCGGCQLVNYCSRDCQEDDRKNHKRICKKFPVANGKNIYHTTGSWEKHIDGLRKQVAQLPKSQNGIAERIFLHPKVCNTCHEPRPDHLKVCKCNIVCYCSEKCAKIDNVHRKSCNELSSMMKSSSLEVVRGSFPTSFLNFLEELERDHFKDNKGCSVLDYPIMKIHIVTNNVYYDAQAWDFLFDKLPKLHVLDLTFIIQDAQNNESLNIHQRQLAVPGYSSNERMLVYSVYQKPYHMYFSSSAFTKADFVVTYGISDPMYDLHNIVSYRNMTHYSSTVLVLMDSTKELVSKTINYVKAAQPTVVLLATQVTGYRGFGGFGQNHLHNDYKEDAPNVKKYQAVLHRPSGEKY